MSGPYKRSKAAKTVPSPGRKSLRGVGLAFINAYSAYRRRRQSRIGAGKQRRINPLRASRRRSSPRALYFNDSVAVGFFKEGEVSEVTTYPLPCRYPSPLLVAPTACRAPSGSVNTEAQNGRCGGTERPPHLKRERSWGAPLTKSDSARCLQRMWVLEARIGVAAPRLG